MALDAEALPLGKAQAGSAVIAHLAAKLSSALCLAKSQGILIEQRADSLLTPGRVYHDLYIEQAWRHPGVAPGIIEADDLALGVQRHHALPDLALRRLGFPFCKLFDGDWLRLTRRAQFCQAWKVGLGLKRSQTN